MFSNNPTVPIKTYLQSHNKMCFNCGGRVPYHVTKGQRTPKIQFLSYVESFSTPPRLYNSRAQHELKPWNVQIMAIIVVQTTALSSKPSDGPCPPIFIISERSTWVAFLRQLICFHRRSKSFAKTSNIIRVSRKLAISISERQHHPAFDHDALAQKYVVRSPCSIKK